MMEIYERHGIEHLLDTRWTGSRWDDIYPGLMSLEAVEDSTSSFVGEVRNLLEHTVERLKTEFEKQWSEGMV